MRTSLGTEKRLGFLHGVWYGMLVMYTGCLRRFCAGEFSSIMGNLSISQGLLDLSFRAGVSRAAELLN